MAMSDLLEQTIINNERCGAFIVMCIILQAHRKNLLFTQITRNSMSEIRDEFEVIQQICFHWRMTTLDNFSRASRALR